MKANNTMSDTKLSATRDVLKAKKVMVHKTEELSTVRENYKALTETLTPLMVQNKESFMDCGKHGCIELKREGKPPKNWQLATYTKFFQGDNIKAAQLIDYMKEEKKRLCKDTYANDPSFSINVCVEEEKANKLRTKYCPGQSVFEGMAQ